MKDEKIVLRPSSALFYCILSVNFNAQVKLLNVIRFLQKWYVIDIWHELGFTFLYLD